MVAGVAGGTALECTAQPPEEVEADLYVIGPETLLAGLGMDGPDDREVVLVGVVFGERPDHGQSE